MAKATVARNRKRTPIISVFIAKIFQV